MSGREEGKILDTRFVFLLDLHRRPAPVKEMTADEHGEVRTDKWRARADDTSKESQVKLSESDTPLERGEGGEVACLQRRLDLTH